MRRSCLVFLLLVAGCSRCAGERSAQSAEELLPPHPAGAVVTAPLGLIAQHAAALIERAGALPGGEQLTELRKGVAAQLGFDPLTRDGLLAAGLDPDRGAALALPQPRSWVLALPLTSPEKFLGSFDRVARERAGYAVKTDEARADVRVALYSRDEARKVAVAVVRGYGVIGRGEDPAGLVSAKRTETFARDSLLATARQRLGAQDLIITMPSGSELPKRFLARGLPADAALSISGSAQGVALRLFAQLPEADAAEARAALPGGGAALFDFLPGDAFLRARLGVSSERIVAFAAQLPVLAPVLQRVPPELTRELFASLAPGVALSLGVAHGASLAEAVDYGLDWRRKSPFETVQLVALAAVADKPRFLRALDAAALALPSLGAEVKRDGDDLQLSYQGLRGARIGLRELDGRPAAYLLGGELAPEALRKLPRPVAPDVAALYADPGAALRLDLGKLNEAIHALPDTTYGSGPQSYVTRSIVGQVVDPLRPLRVTLTAQPLPEGLGAELTVELAAP